MAPLVEVKTGQVRWLVASELRDRLLGPEGLRLAEWLRAGCARVVKDGPHRTVYRVVLPGLRFYLKHYRVGDARARLRQLFRPTKARMEYERALAVARRDIATVTPLGLGETVASGGPPDSFLMTRSLDNALSLSDFIERTLRAHDLREQSVLRQNLAGDLGRFIAGLHDAGIFHPDLHAGNILARLETEDRPRLFLIDLHTIIIGRPLHWKARRDNLIILNRWFTLRSSRADRMRFWHAYLAASGSAVCHGCVSRAAASTAETAVAHPRARPSPLAPHLSQGAADLEERTWRSNLQFWKRRDRRCLRTNRYFQRVSSPVAGGHAVRDLDPAFLNGLLADPDEPFRRGTAKILKDSPSSMVVELAIQDGAGVRSLVYKRFPVTKRSDPWTALVRRTPALRSWIHGHGLRERLLATPRPLAVLHRRRHHLSHEGYLLTEKIENVVDLHRAALDLARSESPGRRLAWRRIIDRTAELIREMHGRRLGHRDLKTANLLIQDLDGDSRVWVIDLAGMKRYRRLSWSRRLQNLARLNASFHQSPWVGSTDKLRFLRVYLQWGLRGRAGWKRWWKAIERATERKVKRNLRNGRPLG